MTGGSPIYGNPHLGQLRRIIRFGPGHGRRGVVELLHPGAADTLRWLSTEWPHPGEVFPTSWKHRGIESVGFFNYI